MTVNRYLRMLAGAFVLISLALGHWVHEGWYLFTAFVGLNLFQSAFTNWCPAMTLLTKLGVPMCSHEANLSNRPGTQPTTAFAPSDKRR